MGFPPLCFNFNEIIFRVFIWKSRHSNCPFSFILKIIFLFFGCLKSETNVSFSSLVFWNIISVFYCGILMYLPLLFTNSWIDLFQTDQQWILITRTICWWKGGKAKRTHLQAHPPERPTGSIWQRPSTWTGLEFSLSRTSPLLRSSCSHLISSLLSSRISPPSPSEAFLRWVYDSSLAFQSFVV